MCKNQTSLNSQDPDPEDWWENFNATRTLYQLQEMQKMAASGHTQDEIRQHFEIKYKLPKENSWLGVIQHAEEQRRILERENRAERKHQRQLETARQLAERHQTHKEEFWINLSSDE
jgi:hypothetical protein